MLGDQGNAQFLIIVTLEHFSIAQSSFDDQKSSIIDHNVRSSSRLSVHYPQIELGLFVDLSSVQGVLRSYLSSTHQRRLVWPHDVPAMLHLKE